MKKIFTLLAVMMLVFVSANAQSRKTWDFTKGVSEETRAALDADISKWTKSVNGDGVTTNWTSNANIDGEATMGGVVVPELAGLYFGNFAATNALSYYGTKIRLQKNCTITLKGLSADQKIAIKYQSANADAKDRGIGLSNANIVEGPEDGICLGNKVEGAPEGGVTSIVANVDADGDVVISTGCNGAPASGIEILSIIIDEGDKNIKKWDFSNWSDATKAQVCAAEDWTTAESASKNYITGDEIRWNAAEATYDANFDITAGGEAIKELKGLRHAGVAAYGYGIAFDYGTTLDSNSWGPYNGGSYLWVMGANSTITIPNVKAGSTLKIASESHKPSEARGFNVTVGGAAVASSTGTSTSIDYTVFEYTIPTGDEEFVDVVLKATKGCHLYSIEAEVKDEAVVDKNPKLGNPKFVGIPVGKVNPNSGDLVFTMTFPQAQNITADVAVTAAGYFGPATLEEGESADNYMFDGIEGTVVEGVSFNSSDFSIALAENSEYEFYLTSLVVDGYEALNKEAAEGEKLYGFKFETSGEGIAEPREWNFTLSAEDAEDIAKSIDAGKTYWVASSKGRYSYATPISYKQLMTDDETPFARTAGLYFTMTSANDILVGTPAHTGVGGAANAGGNNGRLQLGGGSPRLIIPQCSAGDEVTIKALYADSKKGLITITNGVVADTEETTIQTGKSAAEYKIIVKENGDLELASNLVVYQTISIFPASISKKEINYVVAATDPEGNAIKTLAEGTGMTNDKVDVLFPFYLTDEEGNVFTNGARGTEFKQSVILGEDEIYAVNYKKANIEGLVKGVFCAEAEDLEGTIPSESNNLGIRASMGKAAYNDKDIELCTLEPGTYQIKAMVWDETKNGGATRLVFTCGDQEVEIYSTGDNMSEALSEAFTVTESTKLVWSASGNNNSGHCLDAILVYQYDVEATAISNVTSNAIAVKAQKVIENGNLVIKTAKGTFSVAGAQMK